MSKLNILMPYITTLVALVVPFFIKWQELVAVSEENIRRSKKGFAEKSLLKKQEAFEKLITDAGYAIGNPSADSIKQLGASSCVALVYADDALSKIINDKVSDIMDLIENQDGLKTSFKYIELMLLAQELRKDLSAERIDCQRY